MSNPKNFAELAPQSGKRLDEVHVLIVKNIDDRAAYETKKNPNNLKIHKTLTSIRNSCSVSKDVARCFIAANVDPNFINASRHEGARYNVYAIQKVADVARALIAEKGQMGNAINKALVRSLFAFDKAGKVFNMEMAKAAASDKIRVEKEFRDLLTRHTVSASTAPTQASSTMQALQTLGIVKAEGSAKNPVYKLTDTPARQHLEAMIGA